MSELELEPWSDPFDVPGEEELVRDRWDRPMIKPDPATGGAWPDTGTNELRPYTRASTFAGYLDDGIALSTWRSRHIALSVAKRPDLAAVIAGLEYHDKDLDERIKEALERAKDAEATLQASNWGTAMHRFTEPDSPPDVPDRLKKDVPAFFRAVKDTRCQIVATELFVVNDDYWAAGTFDHLVRLPEGTRHVFATGRVVDLGGRIVVADKKGGKMHKLSHAVQLATYAGGGYYDVPTGRRDPLHPDLDPTVGLLMHIPFGKGKADLWLVDLEAAHHFALAAMVVRSARSYESRLFSAQPLNAKPTGKKQISAR